MSLPRLCLLLMEALPRLCWWGLLSAQTIAEGRATTTIRINICSHMHIHMHRFRPSRGKVGREPGPHRLCRRPPHHHHHLCILAAVAVAAAATTRQGPVEDLHIYHLCHHRHSMCLCHEVSTWRQAAEPLCHRHRRTR
jgi:hypothetical protein